MLCFDPPADLHCLPAAQTGDAVAMLGTLRPDTALLITSDALSPPTSPTTEVNQLSKMDTATTSATETATIAKPSSSPASALGPLATVSLPTSHLDLADLILIQPGSLPPCDGTIVSGTTTFDESSLTGESKPVKKGPGDEVLTGTVNLTGAVVVRVERLGEETMIEKIVRAVGEAQGEKSPVEVLAEKVTGVFVPVVVSRLTSASGSVLRKVWLTDFDRLVQVYVAILVLIVWLSLTLSGTLSDATLRKGDNPSSGDRVFFAFEFFIAVLGQSLLRSGSLILRTPSDPSFTSQCSRRLSLWHRTRRPHRRGRRAWSRRPEGDPRPGRWNRLPGRYQGRHGRLR